jgi:hypothetical protein
MMIAAVRIFVALALSIVGAFATQDATLSKEDKAFWGRFLEDQTSIPGPVERKYRGQLAGIGVFPNCFSEQL